MQQTIDFILELDKLKAVTRKVRPLNQQRYENSAEHSWQIAMLALSLKDFCAPDVDMDRVVRMLLIHDIGEIDTGDTMVFVEEGWQQRKADEEAAATRIFGLLPSPRRNDFMSLWLEFEREQTASACFANAVDRAMPVLLNLANKGQSWRENGISHARLVARIAPQISKGCPLLWEYLESRLESARTQGYFGA